MRNVFTVPADKSALDFVKGMKETLKKNWIFLHRDLVIWMEENAKTRNSNSLGEFDKQLKVSFYYEENFSVKIISISRGGNAKWFEVTEVAEGKEKIEYPSDPNGILFYSRVNPE